MSAGGFLRRGAPPARLLRKHRRGLCESQAPRGQALRALRVETQALLVEAHGLVEIERRILELVGDRLETLERFVERDLRLSHCARQSPPTRPLARRASGRG